MGESIMLGTVTQAAREIASLGKWDGTRANFAAVSATGAKKVQATEALLTSWRRLLDLGTLQKGEANLAGTARKSVAVISPKRAETLGVKDGDILRVANSYGSISLPALVEDIHDDAVWVPRNSFGTQTLISLNAVHGDVVTVVKA
jgi:NADH-quinone oxidoreductase subunit G